MAKWEEKKLHNICDVISGYAFKSDDFVEEGIPIIKIANIGNGFCDINNNTQYVSSDFLKELNRKYIVDRNSVLISLTGSHITQPNSMVGRSCRYTYAYNSLLNQRAGRIIPKHSTKQGLFIYYVMQTQWIKEYIGLVAYGAANQANISPKTIEKIKVPTPDLPTQERIADILSAYDDLIENNNRRIELLEKAAQDLYKEWFVRFRFPGHETTKFENALPVGWKRKKIEVYYKTCSGGTPSRSKPEYYENGTIPWVKTGEIKDGIIIDTEEHITQSAIKGSSAKMLPEKSVAMAMYGVNIGMLSYFDTGMTCNQACCVFEDKRLFSSKHYLFYFLKSIREYLLLIGFGAAQQNLSQDLIKKIKVLMPKDEIVVLFEEKIDRIYLSMKNLLQQNLNLKKQRDLLLPRLMSGKLEV